MALRPSFTSKSNWFTLLFSHFINVLQNYSIQYLFHLNAKACGMLIQQLQEQVLLRVNYTTDGSLVAMQYS